jgi:hypothetical protein
MRVINLDALGWKSTDDFYDAILAALEAPHWHGRNVNALVDSMWGGSINGIEPPYKIWIINTIGLPHDVMQQIQWMVTDVNKCQGRERDILFQIDP